MGCDIHLFAEVKKTPNLFQKLFLRRKPKWESLEEWELDKDYEPPKHCALGGTKTYTGGRNYNLFAALCGVRSSHFHESRSISEPKGVPKDVSVFIRMEIEYWDTDGHSHSYNTLNELERFDWSGYGNTVNQFLAEVIPKLKAQKVSGDNVRIVYFFDN